MLLRSDAAGDNSSGGGRASDDDGLVEKRRQLDEVVALRQSFGALASQDEHGHAEFVTLATWTVMRRDPWLRRGSSHSRAGDAFRKRVFYRCGALVPLDGRRRGSGGSKCAFNLSYNRCVY